MASSSPGGATMKNTCPPPLERKVISVGGLPTEIIDMEASSSSPRLQVLVVPGNPGNAGYYRHFMKELHKNLRGHARITGVSHLGHAAGIDWKGKLYHLEDQIQHKVDLITEHYTGDDKPPIAIMGHSIGTYIVTHATNRIDKTLATSAAGTAPVGGKRAVDGTDATAKPINPSPIRKMIGLMPFMTTDWQQPTQVKMNRLTKFHGPISYAVGALGLLPHGLKKRIVKMFEPHINDDTADLTCNLLTKNVFENTFYMAKTEFEDLNKPAEWHLVKELGAERVAMVGTSDDAWCQPWKWEHMKEQLPPQTELLWEEEQIHAFCAHDALSASLAVKTAALLEPLIAEDPRESKRAKGLEGGGGAEDAVGVEGVAVELAEGGAGEGAGAGAEEGTAGGKKGKGKGRKKKSME